ncbi:MAG: SMC-Scp complex subunit ScpB [Gammaproteobacteria bacterium]|nr:SMC-Scp complex subunit ScpB [Gammaproteobacteria bacterium]
MSDLILKPIVEAALLAAGAPLTLDTILDLFLEEERPSKKVLREVIEELAEDYRDRGCEVMEVGGGFRISVRAEYSTWVSRLWDERPPRYSRAMLETLALIAYRQPITRGEIEDIRGVSVSTNIVKTMLEREWIRVVGHRDVPGKPSLFATTREFLTYFGLKSLDELPTLQEIRDLDSINRELELGLPGAPLSADGASPSSGPGVAEPDENSTRGDNPSSESSISEPESNDGSDTQLEASLAGSAGSVPASPSDTTIEGSAPTSEPEPSNGNLTDGTIVSKKEEPADNEKTVSNSGESKTEDEPTSNHHQIDIKNSDG